jgi:hypothetical protein
MNADYSRPLEMTIRRKPPLSLAAVSARENSAAGESGTYLPTAVTDRRYTGSRRGYCQLESQSLVFPPDFWPPVEKRSKKPLPL